MTKRILSWLLHHANREYKNERFYKVKDKILSKYGKHICYDVQFIEGKKCWTCGGSGVYHGYYGNDLCRHCYNGWYKRPQWNILERIQFGKYIFHRPYQRAYIKPDVSFPMIEGYIEHKRSKYGWLARHILFLIYEKGYLRRYYNQAGLGWRVYWWLPTNWIPNALHIIKRGRKSIPIVRYKERHKRKSITQQYQSSLNQDLPF